MSQEPQLPLSIKVTYISYVSERIESEMNGARRESPTGLKAIPLIDPLVTEMVILCLSYYFDTKTR